MTKSMDCDEFRELYPKHTDYPVSREVWDTEEGHHWKKHFIECRLCTDWHQQQEVQKRGANLTDYPCVHMAFHATFRCEEHPDLRECSDSVVRFDERWDEYSIVSRGGMGDEYVISNCPWCGVSLPESKRDLWFDKLEQMGIDIHEDVLPAQYNSNAWRQE